IHLMFIIYIEKIIIISIISVIALILSLFLVVNVRRLIKYLYYKRLDLAREKYQEILRPLLKYNTDITCDFFSVKKRSLEWKALEDVLFNAITNGDATKEVITDIFD